jgi:tripartite-type tricarboxylate transporter receptor subunit TctC
MSWAVRLLVALTFSAISVCAQAQQFPTKPVTLLVPWSAGGGIDSLARILGQYLAAAWGQQVIVLNKPGANAIIGTEFVVRSAPDGYTLLVSDLGLVNNSSLYRKLPYDPFKDLVPVGGLVSNTHALVAGPSLSIKNVPELIALAKEKPGKLTYASFGLGSSAHLTIELFQAMAGVKLLHVPYKGSAPALTDVAAGHVDIMSSTIRSVLPNLRPDMMRMLAVSSAQRTPRFPDVPTIAEAGLPGFEVTTWAGLNAPAGTPRAIIDTINTAVRRILADPAFREKYLEPEVSESIAGIPEQFSDFLNSESAKWSKVIRNANVQLE